MFDRRLLFLLTLLILGPGLPGQAPTALHSTVPAANQLGVQADAPVVVRFTGPIQGGPGLASGFSFSQGTNALTFRASLSANRKVVTLRLNTPAAVANGATVMLTVDGGNLLDAQGLQVDADGDGQPGGTGTIAFVVGIPPVHPLGVDAAMVIGRVFDPSGAPLVGARIDSVLFPATEGDPPLPVPDGVTDATGAFTYRTIVFTGTGDFLVRVRKPGHSEILRRATVMAGTCFSIGDVTLQTVTPRVPVTVAQGTSTPLIDPAAPGRTSLSIPPMALQANSDVGVTVLQDASFLREELPPLVASAGTFVDVAGVFGEQTTVPVTMTFDNPHGLPVGTRVPFGKVDHNTLVWSDLRDLYQGPGPVPDSYLGTVRSDGMGGTYIEVAFDHFCSICTGYCLPYPTPEILPGGQDPNGAPEGPNRDCGNSEVERREGFLWKELFLPGFFEFGEEVRLGFGYASHAAAPTVTLNACVDYASTRPVERTIFAFQIEGRAIEAAYDRSSGGEMPHANWIWDGRDGLGRLLPTGTYAFQTEVVSLNANAQVAIPNQFAGPAVTTFTGAGGQPVTYPGLQPLRAAPVQGEQRATIVNLADSPFGAGWSCLQESRLVFDPDGCILLVRGNANYRRYEPNLQANNAWISPPGDVSNLSRSTSDGTYRIVWPDGAVESYSPAGRVQWIENRFGQRMTFAYSGDLLASITTAAGNRWTFGYVQGRLRLVRDSAGRVTEFEVDGAGDLRRFRDPSGARLSFDYDADHRLVRLTRPRGERSEYDYTQGRVTEARVYDVQGGGLLRRRQWRPSALNGEIGRALSIGQGTLGNPIPLVTDRVDVAIDGRGGEVRHWTDALGRTSRLVDQIGRTIAFSYGADGRISALTYADGVRREYDHDATGTISATRIYDAAGQLLGVRTAETHGPFGLISRVVDEEGRETTYEYTPTGLVSIIRDHGGHATTFTYADPRVPQRATRVTAPSGRFLDRAYDASGNLASFTDHPMTVAFPAGRTTSLIRDDVGRVVLEQDAAGRIRQYAYDSLNRMIRRDEGQGVVLLFDYTDRVTGQPGAVLGTLTLPDGSTVGVEHDGLGRVIRQIDRAQRVTAYEYDAESNLTRSVNRMGEEVRFTFDPSGQLLAKELPGSRITRFAYDASGALALAEDAHCTLRFDRDALARVTRYESAVNVSLPGGGRLGLVHELFATYDRVGNRTSLRSSDGLVDLTYSYDDLHRMIGIADAAVPGGSWSLQYDRDGRRTRLARPGSAGDTSYAFDGAGQLLDLSHAANPAIGFSIPMRDGLGDILQKVTTMAGMPMTTDYAYDGGRRLVRATDAMAPPGTTTSQQLTFGPDGRLSTDGPHAYAFDAEGRLLTKTVMATGVVEAFSWDAEDRLLSHREQVPDGAGLRTVVETTYDYDPLGRRIAKTVNGVATRWLHDEADLLLEYDDRGRTETRFVHGPGIDELLGFENLAEGRFHHVCLDTASSPVAILDGAGLIEQVILRDEFGRETFQSMTGVWPILGSTGSPVDLETGLRHQRARYLDPRLGRFLSEDPAQHLASLDLYSYLLGNPLQLADPSGENPVIIAGAIAGGLCGGITTALSGGSLGDIVLDTVVGAGTGALGAAGGLGVGKLATKLAPKVLPIITKGVGGAAVGVGSEVAGQATKNLFNPDKPEPLAGAAGSGLAGTAIGAGVEKAGDRFDEFRGNTIPDTGGRAPTLRDHYRGPSGRRFIRNGVGGCALGALWNRFAAPTVNGWISSIF